jgi:outer membrane protein OmpA-like peptidoglycan-associated protein
VSNLLPGLIVEIKGSGGDRGNLVADKISFHSSALRVAEQVAAGTVALSMRVDANTDSIKSLKSQVTDSLSAINARVADSLSAITARARDSLAKIHIRFDDINKYDVRDSATVNFSTGSAVLTNGDKAALDAIAASAVTQEGYLLEVTGYTDDTGTEPRNFRLSDRRAEAVVDYLVRERNVPIRRVLNPTGFGEEKPVATNDSAAGRAMNRRAEVKVLVNRADRK